MGLPVLKLGRVALKTVSKPIQKEAYRHPMFTSLIPQSNDRITTTMHRRMHGHATDVEIRSLKGDKAAVSMGKVFGWVALGRLIYEVERSARLSGISEAIEVVLEEVTEEENRITETYEENLKELELLKQKIAEINLIAWIQEANPKLSDV